MAEEQPDFIAQFRALNPDAGLEKYDDQTLAALVGDQHPEYRPRLAKYLHPATASTGVQELPDSGSAAADLEKTLPTKRTTLAEAINSPSPGLTRWAENLQSGDPRANIGKGIAKTVVGMMTPGNAALIGGLGEAPPSVAKPVSGLFGTQQAWGVVKSIPELARLAANRDWAKLEERMTETGLGAVFAGLGLAHAASGLKAPAAEPPSSTPAAEEIAPLKATQKATEKAAKVVSDVGPDTTEASKAQNSKVLLPDGPWNGKTSLQGRPAIRLPDGKIIVGGEDASNHGDVLMEHAPPGKEMLSPEPGMQSGFIRGDSFHESPNREWVNVDETYQGPSRIDEMRPKDVGPPEPAEGPPIVKGQRGEKVIPNDDANERLTEQMKIPMRQAGVDVNDPQAVANFLGRTYRLTKPIEVTSVGDVPVSESSETPTDYQFDLAKGTADKVAHEVQHARVQEGQIPEVPEGPGANDQIVGQTTQDIGGEIPKYAEPSNVNLNRLDISDEAKRGIMEVAAEVGRQTPIPREQTIASASAIGANLDLAKQIADGTKDLHVQVEAVKQFEGRAAENYAAAKASGNPAEIQRTRKILLEGVKAASDTLANAGRGLAAAGIDTKPGPEAQVALEIGKLINEMEGRGKDATALKEKLDATDLTDPVQRNKLRKVAGIKGFTWNQKLGYYYVNSIISALPTAGIKAASDVATILSSPVRTLVGAAANKLTGAETHPIAETGARVAGMWSSLNDAMSAFAETLKSGSSIYKRTPPITGKTGYVIGTPMRLLGAITDAARHVNIRGELYEQGMREALNSGKTGAEAWDHAREYANDPPEEGLAAATTEAAKDTLTQPPGKWTKGLLHFREQVPGAIVEIPIVTTPQNLVKVAFETSPLGFGSILKDGLVLGLPDGQGRQADRSRTDGSAGVRRALQDRLAPRIAPDPDGLHAAPVSRPLRLLARDGCRCRRDPEGRPAGQGRHAVRAVRDRLRRPHQPVHPRATHAPGPGRDVRDASESRALPDRRRSRSGGIRALDRGPRWCVDRRQPAEGRQLRRGRPSPRAILARGPLTQAGYVRRADRGAGHTARTVVVADGALRGPRHVRAGVGLHEGQDRPGLRHDAHDHPRPEKQFCPQPRGSGPARGHHRPEGQVDDGYPGEAGHRILRQD
jgi:hypothetical protein